MGDLKRFSCRASSINAVLIRSVGVTANILAMIPELIPASMLRRGVRAPVSGSAKAFLIVSKDKKRTPSLATEPMTREEQPLYKARAPSSRKTWLTTRKGLRGVGTPFCWRSWTRVLANSNGYYVCIRLTIILAPEWRWLTVDAASTAPAIPPEMTDTIAGVLDS